MLFLDYSHWVQNLARKIKDKLCILSISKISIILKNKYRTIKSILRKITSVWSYNVTPFQQKLASLSGRNILPSNINTNNTDDNNKRESSSDIKPNEIIIMIFSEESESFDVKGLLIITYILLIEDIITGLEMAHEI